MEVDRQITAKENPEEFTMETEVNTFKTSNQTNSPITAATSSGTGKETKKIIDPIDTPKWENGNNNISLIQEKRASYSSLSTEIQNTDYYERADKPELKDKFYLLHMLFFLLGIVSLMPLSFVVTANSYWMHKFKNDDQEKVNLNEKNVLQSYFSSGTTIFQILPGAFVTPLVSAYGHKFKIRFRLFTCLVVFAGCLCLCNLFIKIDITSWKTGFFFLTMAEVFIINIIFSVFFVTSMVLVACFPNSFMKPYLFGEGFSGVFTSTLQVISLALGNDPEVSAFIYFSTGTVIMLLTAFLLYLAKYLEVYTYYTGQKPENTKRDTHSRSEIIMIAKRMWPCPVIFALAIVVIVAVHPSVTSLIVPENYGSGDVWSEKYFIPVITFLFTDICGVIGRYFGRGIITTSNGGWLILLSILRAFIFIPLILLCHLIPRHNLPVIFNHDWQYIVFIGSLTFTNGYIHNCVFLSIGKLVPENKELAFLIFASFLHILCCAVSPIGILLVRML